MLGKRIAESLDTHDFLGRWMAHHIAEKITALEELTGGERDDSERQIAELIVQLWATRRTAAFEYDPLEQVDAVGRALARLDPERRPWGYFNQFAEGAEPSTPELEANQALEVALQIDRLAGDLVRSLVSHAATLAAANDAEWLEVARGADPDPLDSFFSLLSAYRGEDGATADDSGGSSAQVDDANGQPPTEEVGPTLRRVILHARDLVALLAPLDDARVHSGPASRSSRRLRPPRSTKD